MPRRRLWRFLIEVVFLGGLAALAAVARMRPEAVVGVMAFGWVVVALAEWSSWLDRPHFGRGLPPRYYVPLISLPDPENVDQTRIRRPAEAWQVEDAETWIASSAPGATSFEAWPVLDLERAGEETELVAAPELSEDTAVVELPPGGLPLPAPIAEPPLQTALGAGLDAALDATIAAPPPEPPLPAATTPAPAPLADAVATAAPTAVPPAAPIVPAEQTRVEPAPPPLAPAASAAPAGSVVLPPLPPRVDTDEAEAGAHLGAQGGVDADEEVTGEDVASDDVAAGAPPPRRDQLPEFPPLPPPAPGAIVLHHIDPFSAGARGRRFRRRGEPEGVLELRDRPSDERPLPAFFHAARTRTRP